MVSNDEELVRINITRGKARSTVSMDAYLAEVLRNKLGGQAQMQAWVQETTEALERAWQEQAMTAAAGDKVHAKSGFSRLIQREALKYVLGVDSQDKTGIQ